MKNFLIVGPILFPLLQFHNLSLTINFAFGSLVMNFKVIPDVIFNMEVFTYEYFSSLRMRDVSQLSDTLRFFTLFPLIDQQAYLSIWQIKVLHTYSIIRLTRISCSIIWNVNGVTKFFPFL